MQPFSLHLRNTLSLDMLRLKTIHVLNQIKSTLLLCILLSCSFMPKAETIQSLQDSADFYKLKDYNKTRLYATQIIEKAELTENNLAKAQAYVSIGTAHYYSGNQDSALYFYLKALKIFETNQDKSGIAQVKNELGVLFLKQKKYADAKRMLFETIHSQKTDKPLSVVATSYNNLGLVYADLQMPDSAEYYFNKALKTYRELNDKLGISYALDYLSSIYAGKQKWEDAEHALKESISLRSQLSDKTGTAIAINNLGELYLSKKNYTEALHQFKTASDSAHKINYLDLEAYTYKMQAETYKLMGDYKNSVFYFEKYQSLNEEILNEKRIRQIEELNTQYQTEKKENEIQQQRLKLSKRNVMLSAVLLILGLSIVSFYLLYNRYKLKQEARLQEELMHEQQIRTKAVLEAEENERQRIAKELHDGVGQLLSATKLNLNAASSITNETNAAQQKLLNGIELLDESIKEVRNISHNMMPAVLQENGLCAAIEDFIRKINQAGSLNVTHSIYNLQQDRFDKTAQLTLYRIIQEIFNNIIKHAKATKVNMECVGHDDEIVVIIEDNGIGFDTLSKKEGIGLKNIRLRVDFLKGNFDIDSANEKGTTTILEIPYTT